MKRISNRRGIAAAAVTLTLLAGFIFGQTHITRFQATSGGNTTTIDVVHNVPEFDFKGEKPVLKLISGSKQQKASGFLPQPIVIAVYHADGATPWPSAPVTLAVEYGKGGWAAKAGGAVSQSLTVTADGRGFVQAYYWMP